MTNVQHMNNTELLSVILRSSDADLPKRITDYLASATQLPKAADLMRIRGVGKVKAQQVLAAMELSARYMVANDATSIDSPEDIVPRLSWLKYEQQEHFLVATLDSANHVIGIHEVTKGLANNTPAHSREVFAKAIEDRAVSVIICHNHPSGSKAPSPEDMALTRVLCAAGKILQIPIIDHVVISKSGFTSICRTHTDIFESNYSL